MQAVAKTKEEVLKGLAKQREKIEDEMETLVDVLESMPGSPGLKQPLVDKEGFPRGDCDLIEVRKLRHQHICLQTDHKTVMK